MTNPLAQAQPMPQAEPASVPDGFVLVPREPTREMCQAFYEVGPDDGFMVSYSNMLDAAPLAEKAAGRAAAESEGTAQAELVADETGWLVEREAWLGLRPENFPNMGPKWLKIDGEHIRYARDASDATRFSRRQDAEAFMRHYLGPSPQDWYARTFRVTEHMWAAAPTPTASVAPTMADAISAGDGTLHGAIDYWQRRALAAEAGRDVDETNKVLADNYLKTTASIAPKAEGEAVELLRALWKSLREHHHGRMPDDVEKAYDAAAKFLVCYAAAPVAQAAAGATWQPIATAPRDGTHILVCQAGRPYDDLWTFNQNPPHVVHWFEFGAPGFYLSHTIGEQSKPYEYTHWRQLGPEPCDTKRLEAEAARYPTTVATLVCPKCGVDRYKTACPSNWDCALVAQAQNTAPRPSADADRASGGGADTERLDWLEARRVSLVPEFEGPWDATVYDDEGEPKFSACGNTPRAAIDAARTTPTTKD